MINSSNIEEKLFLLREGLLEAEEAKATEVYLARHPEARELQALYDPQLTLPKDIYAQDAAFPYKESLKHHPARTIPLKQANSINAWQKEAEEHGLRRLPLGKSYAAAACAIVLVAAGIFLITMAGDPSSSQGTSVAWGGGDTVRPTIVLPVAKSLSDGIAVQHGASHSSQAQGETGAAPKSSRRRPAVKRQTGNVPKDIRIAQKNSEQTQYHATPAASPSWEEGLQEEGHLPAAKAQETQVVMRDDLIAYRDDPTTYADKPQEEASMMVHSNRLINYRSFDTAQVADGCNGLLCWLGITPMLEERLERSQQRLASLEEEWNKYWIGKARKLVRRRY